MTTHIILNAQKYPLSVRLFTPAVDAARGAVLIAPAFGVPQTYYTSFATWLSEQGYVVATFDYSGFAASLAAGDVPLKNIRANMLDWADDAGRVLTMLQTHAPNLPVSWLGHSLGGQLAGLIPNHHLLNKKNLDHRCGQRLLARKYTITQALCLAHVVYFCAVDHADVWLFSW